MLLMNMTLSLFAQWALMHGKSYYTTEEYAYRENVYKANSKKIIAHNMANHTWTMALNKFADLTADEFRIRYTGGYIDGLTKKVGAASTKSLRSSLPTTVDWVAAGAVTPVKNQGQCGSYWSFSTTGAIEGAWYIAKDQLVSLSEQQLVDCSTAEGNNGCNGGMMDYAFQYVISNGGITCESDYPYIATGPNACGAKGKPVCAKISSYQDVTPNSDLALMTAIAQQPVSIAIEADQSVFQFYSGGVMTGACGSTLDHGVLAVGYGTLDGQDYYKVKNSWGPDWGDAGYIMLGRGSTFDPNGQCGILMAPSYPVV
jgi:xylem cysteine proteinase